MKLITGKQGEAHITPAQDSAFHRAYAGKSSGVFDFKLPTASVDSATSFTLSEMELMVQGRWCIIEAGETETISIGSTAGAGQSRIDLLVAKITPNQNGTQSVEWEIVQGKSTSGNPVVPTYDQGDLDSGTVGRYAVWKITVGATAITNIELIADKIIGGGVAPEWKSISVTYGSGVTGAVSAKLNERLKVLMLSGWITLSNDKAPNTQILGLGGTFSASSDYRIVLASAEGKPTQQLKFSGKNLLIASPSNAPMGVYLISEMYAVE